MSLSDVIASRGFWDGTALAYQQLFDKAGTEVVVYIGYAKWGTSTGSKAWFVEKFFYDVDDNVTAILTTGRYPIKWTDRATATYG